MHTSYINILLIIISILLLSILASLLLPFIFKSKKNGESNTSKPNLWGAVRDVFIVAINKGVITPTAIAFVLLIAVLRIPPGDIYKLLSETLLIFKSFGLIGWILLLITVLISSSLLSSTKKTHAKEIKYHEDQLHLQEQKNRTLEGEIRLLKQQIESKSRSKNK